MSQSGVCPTQKVKTTITQSDTVPTKDTYDVDPPNPTNDCSDTIITDTVVAPRPNGTNTTVTTTTGIPGAAGPKGDTGSGLLPSGGSAGQVLAKIDSADYNTEWKTLTSGDIVGGGGGTGTLTFSGKWADATGYVVDQVVEHENSSYVCIQDHTSSKGVNEPDLSLADGDNKGILDSMFETVGTFLGDLFGGDTPPNDPKPYWALLSKGNEKKKGVLGGVFDWIKDIKNWEVTDYLLAAAAAVGIYKAGSEILDLFDQDPLDTPEYNVKFTGDNGYIGAFTAPTLPVVMGSIASEARISNYDTSALPTSEVHLTVRQQGDWRSLVEMLSRAYQFDVVSTFQTNRRLKFIPRTNAPVRTITREEIGFVQGIEGDNPYVGKRLQGSDLPRSIAISYYSEGYSQKYLTQTSYMRTYPQGKDVVISLPLTLSDQAAKDLADLLLMNAHIERNSFSFVTDLNHIDLEAGDVVDVEDIGTVRIDKITTGSQDGTIEFIATDAGINITPQPIYSGATLVGYTASINASSSEPPVTPDVDDEVQPMVLGGGIPLDLPPLNDGDRDFRVHFALHNFGHSSDMNVSIYQSKDGGTTYKKVGASSQKSSWGKVVTPLPTVDNFRIIDEVNTITVTMKSGTLSSCTTAEFYNNKNRAILGNEIIVFRDVTDLGGGQYQLSYLMRGKQGTDVYIDDHEANEMFVMLDDTLVEVPMELTDKDKTYKYKFVNEGFSVANADVRDFAPQFRNYFSLAVTDVTVVRDDATDLFGVRWLRRWKWDNDIQDGISTIADDDFGGYKILVLDTGDDSIVAEYSVQANEWEYPSDLQIEDFGAVQTTIKVKIIPMNKITGPGHPNIGDYTINYFNCGC